MKEKSRRQGFTLVELIVVLVILAILAALLVPALTGYIDKAKKQAVIAEARDVWTASQAALSECYALYPDSFYAKSSNGKSNCGFTVTLKDGTKITDVGRITNSALHAQQQNPNDKVEAGTASRRISAMVLAYLDSADKSNPRYTFGSGAMVVANTKPSKYLGENPKATDVMIQMFHTSDGKLVALYFAKNGYAVTIVPGKETICEKDGYCLSSVQVK